MLLIRLFKDVSKRNKAENKGKKEKISKAHQGESREII